MFRDSCPVISNVFSESRRNTSFEAPTKYWTLLFRWRRESSSFYREWNGPSKMQPCLGVKEHRAYLTREPMRFPCHQTETRGKTNARWRPQEYRNGLGFCNIERICRNAVQRGRLCVNSHASGKIQLIMWLLVFFFNLVRVPYMIKYELPVRMFLFKAGWLLSTFEGCWCPDFLLLQGSSQVLETQRRQGSTFLGSEHALHSNENVPLPRFCCFSVC